MLNNPKISDKVKKILSEAKPDLEFAKRLENYIKNKNNVKIHSNLNL
jgi:hypothetical protein